MLEAMIRGAECIEKTARRSGRIQRLYDPFIAKRCLLMPTTACTIDPLHSSGIAHAVSGVWRICQMILEDGRLERQHEYASDVMQEACFLDSLVDTAYQTIDDFSKFTAACMLYFCSAIACEERTLAGSQPKQFFGVDDADLVTAVKESLALLRSGAPSDVIENRIRERIEPWNTAGLLDRSVCNRYAYTATK